MRPSRTVLTKLWWHGDDRDVVHFILVDPEGFEHRGRARRGEDEPLFAVLEAHLKARVGR